MPETILTLTDRGGGGIKLEIHNWALTTDTIFINAKCLRQHHYFGSKPTSRCVIKLCKQDKQIVFTYSILKVFFEIIHIQQINFISKNISMNIMFLCIQFIYNCRRKKNYELPWKFPKILCFTIINFCQHLFGNNSASFTVQYFQYNILISKRKKLFCN